MAIANDDRKVRYNAGDGQGHPLHITGAGNQLLAFFDSASMTPTSDQVPSDENYNVGQHRRKRFPGDTGHIVRQHVREVTNERASGGGGALKGERFWCERPTGEGDARRSNARQFTYEGTWSNLKRFARANATQSAFTLRNSSGKSITVTPE